MAKIAARDVDLTVNAVSLECYIDNLSLNITQETPDVATFCDAGPRVVPANYNWEESLSGPNDFAAGTLDATLFGMLGNAGVAQTLETTGAVAGPSAPTYTGSVVLGNYNLSWAVGQAAQYSSTLRGTTALTRNVA